MSSAQGGSSEARPRPPPNRRRDKPQLSCNLCRRRKLKCDRRQPCQTCSHRGLPCTYATNNAPAAGVAQHTPGRPRTNVQARLAQLEDLVVSMMDDQGPSRATPPTTDPEGNPLAYSQPLDSGNASSVVASEYYEDASKSSEAGSIRVNSSESRYVGGSHWASILDGIAELKEHLETEEEALTSSATPGSVPTQEEDMEMPLLYSTRPASREEILDCIPSKQVLDRYISYYFNSLDLASAAVHTGKFLREYENFWQSSEETPVMWLGLLYSIMCMAVMSSEQAGFPEAEDSGSLVDLYREKTAQCLLLGRYANGGPYTWETLYHYVVIELSSCKDVTQTIGILHGISMNLLMQMGFHRDPSHFPSISTFTGEMRRRSWVKSMEGDVQMAMQTGMPRRINDGYWDTLEPRNLNDSDFDEETTELPSGRPETEITPVLQLIARSRMLVAVGAAIDISTSVKQHAYSEIMAVDRKIKDAEASIPPPLRMKALAASVTDPPMMIMHRHYLVLMFRVAEIMIHRKYLGTDEDSSAYSRKTCIDACLAVLQIQQTLNAETVSGGLLHTAGSKVLLLGNHEFLLACITLCGVVHRGLHARGNEHALFREEEIRLALRRALLAWQQRGPSSREARIAAESVRLVLKNSGWLDEASENQAHFQGDNRIFETFEGFFGSGGENLGDFPSMMFGGPDMDMEGFPWFVDAMGGDMSLANDVPGPSNLNNTLQ
ncbi:fungal specific transcription factor [Colletotrichum plurivorum]|uniref:Fungal specific transcription factor n=1 Tax=Colletotrichum plurivorum TaxID=2175906 RepID=A0A8H6K406_9PEZI|nr:fungal specific transcription factor [Colletotrichum plurivorum]